MSMKPKESPIDVARSWLDRTLGRTPAGREILEQEKAAENVEAQRAAARAAWDSAEEGKAQLPALHAAAEAARDDYDAALEKYGARLRDARAAYDRAVSSIGSVQQRAERVLRNSADPLIAEHGVILTWLLEKRLHVMRHSGIYATTKREALARRTPFGVRADEREAVDRLKEEVRQADWADSALPAFDSAIEAVRERQLVASPDLPTDVEKILREHLPTKCACGMTFDFTAILPAAAAGIA